MSIQALETYTSPRRTVKPRSLFQFLTWAGGLKPDPDLRAILDGRYGWMVRRKGMSLDDARIACIEEGFLQDHEERDEPSINDLLELIAAEAAGHKQYRICEALDAHEIEAARGLQSPGHDPEPNKPRGKFGARDQKESKSMTKDEYKRLRKRTGLSNYAIAPKIGVSLRAAQRYESGEQDIPETVAKLLRMFVKFGIPDEF